MLTIHCHRCSRSHLVGTRSIVSMHHTSEGLIAYVRCPDGHLTIEAFGHAAATPDPTPAVAVTEPPLAPAAVPAPAHAA